MEDKFSYLESLWASPFEEVEALPALDSESGQFPRLEIELESPFISEAVPESLSELNYEIEFDVFPEEEIKVGKAIAANEKYAIDLRWHHFAIEIYQLLGYEYTDPSDEEFAIAIASWQSKNGLSPADGILGPDTWTAMMKTFIHRASFAHINIAAASAANNRLKSMLGWDKYEYAIYRTLGFHRETPSADTFTKAIALWQPKLGFTGSGIDGRLGEKTWAAIRAFVLQEANKDQVVTVSNEKAVRYEAIIRATPGIYLHRTPSPSSKQTDILYSRGQKVTVVALSTIPAERDWRKIKTFDNRIGWIQEYYLAPISSEVMDAGIVKEPPGAYLVERGDVLDNLVKKFYPDYEIEIGNDRRTIIHAFSILNDGKGALDYKGTSDTWWRDHVLDRDMIDTRRIYQTIHLRENYLIYFPSESYIKILRDKEIVGVRPDWKNAAIVTGKSILGFLKGVAIGFKDAAVDTVVDLWDFLKNIFSGELFRQLYDLYKEFEKYTIGEAMEKVWDLIRGIVGSKVDQIKKDFNSPDPYQKFYTIGKLVGYILFEVVLFILTSGTSLAAKFAVKFAKLVELLSVSKTLTRIVNTTRPAIKASMATWDKAHLFYDVVGIGSAIFNSIESIESIGIEGGDLTITQLDQELEWGNNGNVITEYDLSNTIGDEAEALVIEALRDGDPLFRKQGIPLFDHIVPGIYGLSGHGIDIFGFSVSGDKVSIYIIEVKGGKQPKLRNSRILGRQMGFSWIEDAIDRGLSDGALLKKLEEAFRFYYGRNLSKAEIKSKLLKARRNVVISQHSVQSAVDAIKKLLKTRALRKVGLIKLEVQDEFSDTDLENTEMEAGNGFNIIHHESETSSGLINTWHKGKSYLYFNTVKNHRLTLSNQKQVEKSGLTVSELITALSKTVDINALRELFTNHNQANSANQYNISPEDGGKVDAVFTEAVHQFQIANYLNIADQDGILGQSTLETLGFVNHSLRPKLISSGFYGQEQLNRADIRPEIPVLTSNEFNNSNWFYFILKPSWLGVKITDGIHLLLLRKLREAEAWLSTQPSYKGMTPAEIGRALGFNESTRFSGARLSAEKQAMHGFGLALDINVSGNPWIGAGWVKYDKELLKERYRMLNVLRNAANDDTLPGSTVFEYLDSIARASGNDTNAAYSVLKQRNDEFIAYLRSHPSELAYWRNSQSFARRDPLNGFLHLHPDLVYALRHIAGLAWGAIDFGPRASGDIMHFDLRTTGVGKFICEKIGGYVPVYHPAVTPKVSGEENMWNDQSELFDETELHEAIEEALENSGSIEIPQFQPETGESLHEEMEYDDVEESEVLHHIYFQQYGEDLITDVSKAIRLNQSYANSLGWRQYFNDINQLLLPYSGQQDVSLSDEAFVQALASWQAAQGMSSQSADGILGPNTWRMMKPFIISGNNQSSIPSPSNSADTDAKSDWKDNPTIQSRYSTSQAYEKIINQVIQWGVPDPVHYLVTAINEWNSNPGIHIHFGRNFDGDPHHSYLNLKRLYNKKGILDPAKYIANNIVSIQFFNKKTPGHQDLKIILQAAQEALVASGKNYVLASAWSFVPRTFNTNINSLSHHASGKAIDINPATNPHILNSGQIMIIDRVCQSIFTNGFLAESDPDVFRRASEHFKQNFNESWISLQTESAVITAVRNNRKALNRYASNGFFDLPTPLVQALQNAGLNWGGTWRSAKDFMHFEIT